MNPTQASVLKNIPHLKFIMTDCCNMMCLENLYELRQTCDYFIGSPAEIPDNGAPYDQIVSDMFAGGDKAIVERRMATRWATDKRWIDKYADFTVTDEKFHGVSMFVPQDPSRGNYAQFNEDIKLFEWYKATDLSVLYN